MGPLARRSLGRLIRSGVWGWLVAGAFVLLASAAAAAPLFAEASGNAALIARLAVVPSNALAADAPMVRLVGGVGTAGQYQIDDGFWRIPGLTRGFGTASSIGVETRLKSQLFTPYVRAGVPVPSTQPPDDPGTSDRPTSAAPPAGGERARLYGDDDLVHALVPVAGSPRPGATAGSVSGARPGVWLPAPLARSLAVAVGDPVAVGVQQPGRAREAAAVVAGIYAVGPDGRLPADQKGSHRWAYRRGDAPVDSEFRTLPAFLVVTDVAGARRLATAVGDDLLYAIEGRLRATTLAAAQATVAGIHQRQVDVRDPEVTSASAEQLREQVISGIPTIVSDAARVAERSVAWTRTVGSAGLLLGLLAVLAVAVFGLVRRSVELRHATGLGVRPVAIGALAVVEVLPVAAVCAGVGLLTGWLLITTVGPDGAITAAGVRTAAGHAGLAVAAGVLLSAVAATLAALRVEQLSTPERRARSVPWEALLLAVAVTATAGLFVRPADGGPPSPLDLLVPVLVLAATGAIGARLALYLVRTATVSAGLSFQRHPVPALAVRRVAAGGRQAVLLITVLTLGFGFLIYSLAAASSIRQVTADRVAVLAGAQATMAVEASWLLDDHAARLPVRPPQEPPPDPAQPVPGARTPPLPAGTSIVWRAEITLPPEYDNLDLLVVDPPRFAAVASWGTGPELARARRLLAGLAAADQRATARLRAGQRSEPLPALGVGALLPRAGDRAAVSTLEGDVPIEVRDVLPAFPGTGGELPTVVVAADSFFTYLGQADPRVAPPAGTGRFDRPPAEFFPYLWSRDDPAALQAITDAHGLRPGDSTNYPQIAQEPDLVAARSSIGYQSALGLCVAALAVLALAMFADRSVTRARAADLMLARLGLGRGGTGRARALELGLFALTALLLAGIGVGLIVPLGARLLDPGGGRMPPFVLRLDRNGLGLSVLAALVAVVLAVAIARRRDRSGESAGAVLRDAE